MLKRKQGAPPTERVYTPDDHGREDPRQVSNGLDSSKPSPSKRRNVSRPDDTSQSAASEHEELTSEDELAGSPTPRANDTARLRTPRKNKGLNLTTPSKTNADRSARKKSAQILSDAAENDNSLRDTQAVRLALAVLEGEETLSQTETGSAATTPSKRGRGRPKGAKNKRSPTPEGDIPPEERYFFQTRTGPQQFSSNSFTALGLLEHDDFLRSSKQEENRHDLEIAYLRKLHSRAFPQWLCELEQGFAVCLYGWGSKRRLVEDFAGWIYRKGASRIVVLNGFASKINIRGVLNTIASALLDEDEEVKMTGQTQDMLDQLLTRLSRQGDNVYLLINSMDGPSLRRPSIQALLARLTCHPQVQLLTTADTPSFQLLWNSSMRDHFNFVFHDATTFAPFELETSPVDDVNGLLGRKGRRAGGKEGIGFVLKSLPENARNLYRVLLTELLTLLLDGEDEEDEEGEQPARKAQSGSVGIEYRTLYQKATEEFICSSDMNFRFLLKEFHDHQMLTSMRDAGGTETISVPLSQDEIEAVLEDLLSQ